MVRNGHQPGWAERHQPVCASTIIGGIDSYVSGEAMAIPYEMGLFRTPKNPTGFFPGEAAAFILLERAPTACARGRRIEGYLGSFAAATEQFNRFSNQPPTGRATFDAVMSCLATRAEHTQNVEVTIVNMNGDEFRARDLGCTIARMGTSLSKCIARRWYPPEYFGEIGAATGAASICLGIRGFVRNYAASQSALVILLDDDEGRGAFVIDATNDVNR